MKYARAVLLALVAAALSTPADAQSSRPPRAPAPPQTASVDAGTGFSRATAVPIPKAVVTYFQQQQVFRYEMRRVETDRNGGFGFRVTNDAHTNYTPTTFTTDVPPELRDWVRDNGQAYLGADAPRNARGERMDSTAAFDQMGNYLRHVAREAELTQFVSQWAPVVRGADGSDLLRAIRADPAVTDGIGRYIEAHGLDRLSATQQVEALRAYMDAQLQIAEAYAAVDRMEIEAFLSAQQELARRERAMREAGGEWLIEGDLENGWLEEESEQRMGEMLSEMERIEAQIRARLEAQQMPNLMNGEGFASVPLEQIYDGYDPLAQGTPWVSLNLYPETPSFAPTSLSAAGNSLSSAGNSLSAAGTSLSAAGSSLSATSDGFLYIRGQMGSGGLTGYASTPLAELAPDLAEQLYGALWSRGGQSSWVDLYGRAPTRGLAQTLYDLDGRQSALTDPSALVGFLDDQHALELIALNDLAGLDRLLAQPFNVLATWGAGMYDLDLHMTGPTGVQGERFHIYYAAAGDLDTPPYAQLIRDCICSNGSEVMLTTQLQQGGVYRISTFNFGDQGATSTQMSDQGGVQLMIVRGGEAVAQGEGTTIVGGHVIFQGAPQTGQAGNTWVAVEIDPSNGRIYFVDQFTNSAGSGGVR